ncbi:PREDICTED: beta-taxilin isoform X3 [Nicotiana attenuata]|uniref:beta-taxilin isoform X3 n=1 Tax=Nicotiana attenuata TaxID=49451 RepID=UPI000905B3E0|nr:PREDICTED: beta-taxilin isoform X3 [Nicotiana attenuata]
MENENAIQNPAANQLPEAESLPDGFVGDSSSTDALAPKTPQPEQEKLSHEVIDYKEEKLVDPELNAYEDSENSKCRSAEANMGQDDQVRVKCHNLDNSGGELNQNIPTVKEISLTESAENKKVEASETKRKTVKRTFKSEKEFLEFTLKYQQVLAERDSAVAVRDKLESLCRELQRQNKVLMDECKRVSTEGQNLRLDLSNRFQDAIKEVSNKLEEQKDECLLQLKENEMLKSKLKQLADQYTLSEQQFANKLKQKNLELQLADLKTKQHEEKLKQEQSQMKIYADQVSQLLATEKNLRLQLTADGEKFQQFQEALLKSNEVFETFKQDIEKERGQII